MSEDMRGGYLKKLLPKEPEPDKDGREKPDPSVPKPEQISQIDRFELQILRTMMAFVDRQEVANCITEIALKSGVPKENINYVAFGQYGLYINPTVFKAGATYDQEKNKVTFMGGFLENRGMQKKLVALSESAAKFLTREQKLQKIVNDRETQMLFLWRYIHELVHSMTRVRVIEKKDEETRRTYKTSEIGYNSMTSVAYDGIEGGHTEIFEALNEGVTDRLAQEVFVAYMKRTGLTIDKKGPIALAKQQIYKLHYPADLVPYTKLFHQPYAIHCAMVQQICEKYEAVTGQPWEDLWHGLVAGAFADGAPIFTKEIREQLDEVFGENFLHDLSQLSNKSSLLQRHKFFKKYLGKNLNSQMSPKWLDYLGIKDKPKRFK